MKSRVSNTNLINESVMANSRKQDMVDDRVDQSNGDDYTDTLSVSSAGVETSTVGSREIGLTERLTDIFVEEGDGDLLLQRSDREDRVLQWLQALDMQVMGACRADERLKPLLKSNASSGVAEDRLLAHLSQVHVSRFISFVFLANLADN